MKGLYLFEQTGRIILMEGIMLLRYLVEVEEGRPTDSSLLEIQRAMGQIGNKYEKYLLGLINDIKDASDNGIEGVVLKGNVMSLTNRLDGTLTRRK